MKKYTQCQYEGCELPPTASVKTTLGPSKLHLCDTHIVSAKMKGVVEWCDYATYGQTAPPESFEPTRGSRPLP